MNYVFIFPICLLEFRQLLFLSVRDSLCAVTPYPVFCEDGLETNECFLVLGSATHSSCVRSILRDMVALPSSPSFLLVIHIQTPIKRSHFLSSPVSRLFLGSASSLLICITGVYRPGRLSYPGGRQWKDQSLEAMPSLAACIS